MALRFTRKKAELMPGTLVRCSSGRYIAFYEHRTDIIANGDNEMEAKTNLRKMYKEVTGFEEKREQKPFPVKLPPHTETKHFTERVPCY